MARLAQRIAASNGRAVRSGWSRSMLDLTRVRSHRGLPGRAGARRPPRDLPACGRGVRGSPARSAPSASRPTATGGASGIRAGWAAPVEPGRQRRRLQPAGGAGAGGAARAAKCRRDRGDEPRDPDPARAAARHLRSVSPGRAEPRGIAQRSKGLGLGLFIVQVDRRRARRLHPGHEHAGGGHHVPRQAPRSS